MSRVRISLLGLALAALVIVPACGGKKPPPTAAPAPFPATGTASNTSGNRPPAPPADNTTPTATPVGTDVNATTLDKLNENSPLKPIFFVYDSDELDEIARKTLNENAQVLKDQKTWIITVEGHCDERGSAEYNLALGDRRALAAKNYLLTLGIAADRIRTVSYGKEFPFDPAHSEAAYKMNRRAHFMLTSN